MTTRSRREFLQSSFGATTIAFADSKRRTRFQNSPATTRAPRIKFAVIGMNHSHINGQVQTVTRGGGQLVSFYAKRPFQSDSPKQSLRELNRRSSTIRPFS
jgi:hypothetical protein